METNKRKKNGYALGTSQSALQEYKYPGQPEICFYKTTQLEAIHLWSNFKQVYNMLPNKNKLCYKGY